MLNKDQAYALEKITQHISEGTKYVLLNGSPGTGKSYLISKILESVVNSGSIDPEKIWLTAPTHKAVAVLKKFFNEYCTTAKDEIPEENICTVCNCLGLVVENNFSTGSTNIKKVNKFNDESRYKLIIIDECSMIGRDLYEIITNNTGDATILFVGDEFQLPPVKEGSSIVFDRIYHKYTLNEQMRMENEDIIKFAEALKNTIKNKKYLPRIGNSENITFLTDKDDILASVYENFIVPKDVKIASYSNKSVIDHNEYIRSVVHMYSPTFEKMESLVNNTPIITANHKSSKKGYIPIDSSLTVRSVNPTPITLSDYKNLKVQMLNIYESTGNIFYPLDREEYINVVKQFAKEAKAESDPTKRKLLWRKYFYLKEYVADLRPNYATTVHKLQGTSLDTVIIDLNNLATCRSPIQLARLLYVAVTRARKKIILFGELPKQICK